MQFFFHLKKKIKIFEAVGGGKGKANDMDEICSNLAKMHGVSNQSIKDEAKLPIYNPNLKTEISGWLNNYQSYLTDREFENIKKIKDNNELNEKKKINKIQRIFQTAEARATYNPYQP
ncbi:hypothetical protein Mgra_00004163 [Meloidogyne graminicola]|uniref:Uncharacterized protein n=1 Tax=Meloidogyne graminicola TaxID=189291 RepID=A0A8S9ZRY4_9BILA|nr:hypothetical protein Mgra_00004163 [Meloidogyne graminicola]